MRNRILAFALLATVVCACGVSRDGPPKGNGPEPEPLSGVFSGKLGKMTFNGDGSTVIVFLTGEAAALCPEGKMEYAFTFGARGLCRYDIADRLVLSKDDQNYLFRVQKADGAVLELSKDSVELVLAKMSVPAGTAATEPDSCSCNVLTQANHTCERHPYVPLS